MSIRLLREFIHLLLEKGNVIGEPDLTNQEEREKEKKDSKEQTPDEMSAGGVAGVTTPLGTGPTYPAKVVKRTKKRKKTK